MKKIIASLFIAAESIILILFIVLHNKNTIVRNQDAYDFKLDNGCAGHLFFDNKDTNQLRGVSYADKENHYASLIFDEQLWSINLQDKSIYAFKYENDNGKFVIYAHDLEGKNIVYAINYSDTPKIINAEDFYGNGIILQAEEAIK